ncbi:MAG: radical SAM family heme chaperone HemW [Gammaproteobacteria bacterium]|nr:radical SAM family heme chaperone HemW [Gammaproteobacteria bacterium]
MKFPLSLYIHIPWCIKKCPYCDFNSHAVQGVIPEKEYIDQLIIDLQSQLYAVQERKIHSIFIGGGTPSLFSPEAYVLLFSQLQKYLVFEDGIEITIEANPGTTEAAKLKGYFEAGINRVSLGVQSFQDNQLKILGRIHEADHAKKAVMQAQEAGFKRINIDLMFGLPNQTIADALFDLQTAIDLSPTHISWYQLTLEPNTYFHRFPPVLPSDDYRFEIQQAGQTLLRENGFVQYEISAYAKSALFDKSPPTPLFQRGEQIDPGQLCLQRGEQFDQNICRHNLNYWQFGDYLGIGAGAHGKFTISETGAAARLQSIIRRCNTKQPKKYLAASRTISLANARGSEIFEEKIIARDELPLEFMMNALRLRQPIAIALFETRTGLAFSVIKKQIGKAIDLELLVLNDKTFQVTEKGYLFLNDLLELFV